MHRTQIGRAVSDERVALVEDLRGLPPPAWDAPSLCEGWRIRDVVGHLLRLEPVYRYSVPFFLGLARYGFRVNTYIREDARRRAKGHTPESLLDDLAATRYETTITARWHPWAAVPLSEVIIHGQDIRRPLNIERRFASERLIAVAQILKRRVGVVGRGGRPSNVRFEATDVDWSWGDGEVVRLPMEHVVMRLAGRNV